MKNIGDNYETAAATYLQQHSVRIIAQNVRSKLGEIDIIGLDENKTLLFIEVKGRKKSSHGRPEEFVDTRKQRKIILAAEQYLQQNDLFDTDCRFDVISITGNLEVNEGAKKKFSIDCFLNRTTSDPLDIQWIQNAFQKN